MEKNYFSIYLRIHQLQTALQQFEQHFSLSFQQTFSVVSLGLWRSIRVYECIIW